MASFRVSSMVWRTITWSGSSTGPDTFSWHAAAKGNSAAMTSSASIRWMGGGFLRPPFHRSTSNARLRFQRQRLRNIGDGGTNTALVNVASTEADLRKPATSPSGKLCWGPSDKHTASSEAAACSSKSKFLQNFFRRDSPKARLRRAPLGECTINCMPPVSSKNRSITSRSRVGNVPRIASEAAK